ncbi:MAG: type I restriction-modification system subunit M N-terminal domain-containing protein, partial [Polyangiales bacterium]
MPLPPEFEKDLWAAADLMRSNTGLEPSEYTQPVLSLLFLRFAELRFQRATEALKKAGVEKPEAIDYKSRRVPYLPQSARYEWLLTVPDGGKVVKGEKKSLGALLDDAMRAIERANPDLKGALPETFGKLDDRVLRDFLKRFATIPD